MGFPEPYFVWLVVDVVAVVFVSHAHMVVQLVECLMLHRNCRGVAHAAL